MKGYNPLDPKQAVERIMTAMAALFTVGLVLHLIGLWLGPWLPVIIAVSILSLIAKRVFSRWR